MSFSLAFPRVAVAGMDAAFDFDSSRGAVRDGRFVVGANGSVIAGSFDPSSQALLFNQRLLGSGTNDGFGLTVNLDEPDLLLVGVPNSSAPGVSRQGETAAFHAGGHLVCRRPSIDRCRHASGSFRRKHTDKAWRAIIP